MKKNTAHLLGIAFVVALIATGIFYGLFIGRLRSASADEPRVPVVVMRKAVARGATLEKADVQISMVAVAAAPKKVLSSIEQVDGLQLLEPVAANQPLTENLIASHRSIPAGMRVVSIRATDSNGVVSLLRPGHHVDLQVVGAGTGVDLGLKTFVQDIQVLSVAGNDGGRPVVNLLVTPEQADWVGLADSAAKVRLVLRNPEDKARTASAVLPASTLFQKQDASAR